MREEIDAVYIVYNEFKSVIAQRVVVERILPIIEIGKQRHPQAARDDAEERERAAEAALTAGVSAAKSRTRTEADEEAQEVRHLGSGLHL